MPLYIPRLQRAVSNYVHQPSSRDASEARRVIQEYLADPRTCNSVYEILLDYATKERFSDNAVGKVTLLLRQYINRFHPSTDTLHAIGNFCNSASTCLGKTAPDLQKRLAYLLVLVERLSRQSPSPTTQPWPSILLGPQLLPSLAGGPSTPPVVEPVKESEPAKDAQAHGIFGLSTRTHILLDSNAGSVVEELKLQPRHSAPEKISFCNIDDKLLGLQSTGALHQQPPAQEWLLSSYDDRTGEAPGVFPQELLRFRPPMVWMQGTGISEKENGWLAVQEVPAVLKAEHLWSVIASQKAQEDVEMQELGSLYGAGPLFQYKNYLEQDPLQISSDVLAAIVESVCGTKAAGAEGVQGAGSVWGTSTIDLWEEPGGAKSTGEVGGTVLIKLIIDMFIAMGAQVSYPLVLRMLQDTLSDEDPRVRSHSFDTVYNLSIHSELMLAYKEETIREEAEVPVGDGSPALSNTSRRPPSLFASASPAPSMKSGRGSADRMGYHMAELGSDYQTGKEAASAESDESERRVMRNMDWWLRTLLFDLLIIITQLDESSELVWLSAVGCLLHFVTTSGQILADRVDRLPLTVLSRMLRKCLQFHWAEELHAHLLKLVVNMLYVPLKQQTGMLTTAQVRASPVLSEARLEQFGGAAELIYHLRHTNSTEVGTKLIYTLVDHAATKAGYDSGTVGSLSSLLATSGVLDMMRWTSQHAQPGVADRLHQVFQNCVVPEGAGDTPKSHPLHNRGLSRSSRVSSEFEDLMSLGSTPGLVIKPDMVEGWQLILSGLESMLCVMDPYFESVPRSLEITFNEVNGCGFAGDGAWQELEALLASKVAAERMRGIGWLSKILMMQVGRPSKGKARMPVKSLLPCAPAPGERIESPRNGGCMTSLTKVLAQWLIQPQEGTPIGKEFADLLNRILAYLVSQPHTRIENENRREMRIEETLAMFMGTLSAAMGWLDRIPKKHRLAPLMTVCVKLLEVMCTPPADPRSPKDGNQLRQPSPSLGGSRRGRGPVGSSFIPDSFMIGTVPVYSRLLAALPMPIVETLIQHLDKFFPAYREFPESLGFHGRPGHRPQPQQDAAAVEQCTPWVDSVADVRAVLLLLSFFATSTVPAKKGAANGEQLVRSLCLQYQDDFDVRVSYVASRYLLQHFVQRRPMQYRQALRGFLGYAQQMNDEALIVNPYLQVKNITDMRLAEL